MKRAIAGSTIHMFSAFKFALFYKFKAKLIAVIGYKLFDGLIGCW